MNNTLTKGTSITMDITKQTEIFDKTAFFIEKMEDLCRNEPSRLGTDQPYRVFMLNYISNLRMDLGEMRCALGICGECNSKEDEK